MRLTNGSCVLALGLLSCARPAQPAFTDDALVEVNKLPEAASDTSRGDLSEAGIDAPGIDVTRLDAPSSDRPSEARVDQTPGLDAADRPDLGADTTTLIDAADARDAAVTSDLADTQDIAVTPDVADVADAASLRRVDHCYLSEPAVMEVLPSVAGAQVAALVFVAGVTPGAGAGAMVTVEIGSGPGGSEPLSSALWLWTAATYDRDADGVGVTGARAYDRYQAAAPPRATPGEYAYAARARVAAGPWLACDLVSRVPHSYNPAFAGRVTVALAGAPRVAFCNLQFPRMMSAVAAMEASMPTYGRVFAAGVTDRGCADRPTASALTAELGVGVAGSFPSDATWAWVNGLIEGHRDSVMPLGEGDCHNIEYRATLRAPRVCEAHSYAWRFRRESGPWTYCRWAPPAMDAPTTPSWEVYDPSLAGSLTVTGCL